MYLIFSGMTILLIQLPLDWTAGYLLKAVGSALCMAGAGELRGLCIRQYDALKNNNDDRPPVRVSGLGGIALWKSIYTSMTNEKACFGIQRENAAAMLEKNAAVGAAAAILSAGITALFEFVSKDPTSAGNITASLLGIINTAAALRLVYGMITIFDINDFMMAADSADDTRIKNRKLLLTDNRTDILRMKDIFHKTALCIAVGIASDLANRLVPVQAVQDAAGLLTFMSRLTAYVMIIAFAFRANTVRQSIIRKNGEYIENTDET